MISSGHAIYNPNTYKFVEANNLSNYKYNEINNKNYYNIILPNYLTDNIIANNVICESHKTKCYSVCEK